MKISDVMALVNAGYSKADIDALEQPQNAQNGAQGVQNAQNAQNGAQGVQNAQNAQNGAQGVQNAQNAQNGAQGVQNAQNGTEEMTPGERAIIAAIANMTRTMQASNMANTSVGGNNGLSVEDALAVGVYGNKTQGGNK